MKVLKLTETQKDLLIGFTYCESSFFNPIQDFYDNWIISLEERQYCVNDNFSWLKDLEEIEYKPKETIQYE